MGLAVLLYHANAYYQPEGNRRCDRMGLAELACEDPACVLADPLVARVRTTSPAASSAVSTIFLALEAAGASLLARLIPTLPPDTLLAT